MLLATITVNDFADRLFHAPRATTSVLQDRVTPPTPPPIHVGPTTRELITAIDVANSTTGVVRLELSPNTTYKLTAVNNDWYGPDGLPAIKNDIVIRGNGATIERSTASGTPNFRLFYVSGGLPGELHAGSLTLTDLTLADGLAQGGNGGPGGGGGLGAGGAIFNQGTLALRNVTLTANQALGGSGGSRAFDGGGGGGIGSNASGGTGGGFGGTFSSGFGGAGGANGGGGGGFINDANGSTGPHGRGGGLGGFGAGGGDGGSGGAGGSSGGFGFGGAGGGGGVGGGGGSPAGGGGGSGGFGGGGSSPAGGGGFGGGGGFYGGGGFGGGAGARANLYTDGGGGGAGFGGAVFTMGASNGQGTVTCTNCTLTANTAQGGAGGLKANGGSGYGAAFFNLDGTVTLNDCTLSANTVTAGAGGTGGVAGQADGGAVYNLAYGNNILTGGTVNATLTVNNSILADTTGGVDLASDAMSGTDTNTAAINGNSNLVETIKLVKTPLAGGVITVLSDPQLGALRNNDGPTSTMALTMSSPAYGAGNASVTGLPATDQRILPRTVNGRLDLGAFQLQNSSKVRAVRGATATRLTMGRLKAVAVHAERTVNTLARTHDLSRATARLTNLASQIPDGLEQLAPVWQQNLATYNPLASGSEREFKRQLLSDLKHDVAAAVAAGDFELYGLGAAAYLDSAQLAQSSLDSVTIFNSTGFGITVSASLNGTRRTLPPRTIANGTSSLFDFGLSTNNAISVTVSRTGSRQPPPTDFSLNRSSSGYSGKPFTVSIAGAGNLSRFSMTA